MSEGLERIERECAKVDIICEWAASILDPYPNDNEIMQNQTMAFTEIIDDAAKVIIREAKALSERADMLTRMVNTRHAEQWASKGE